MHLIEMIRSLAKRYPMRRPNQYVVRLIESYCPSCELLIAASPSKKILATMEKLHVCPVYFRYPTKHRLV